MLAAMPVGIMIPVLILLTLLTVQQLKLQYIAVGGGIGVTTVTSVTFFTSVTSVTTVTFFTFFTSVTSVTTVTFFTYVTPVHSLAANDKRNFGDVATDVAHGVVAAWCWYQYMRNVGAVVGTVAVAEVNSKPVQQVVVDNDDCNS